MRLLVTNDDGVTRPGLLSLVRGLLDAGQDVRVLAPARERSGSSASLGTVTHDVRLPTHAVDLPGCPEATAHQVDAPPALAVRAACLGAFGWSPQLVVAGINPGFNTGRLILHSGTVGAALTAASCGIPGIAVSTGSEDPVGLGTAAVLASWLVDLVRGHGLPPVALNLNVPCLPLDRLGGVAEATPAKTGIGDITFVADAPGIRVRRQTNPPPFEPGTDAALVSRGWAPLSVVSPPWMPRPPDCDLAGSLARRWRP